MSINQDDMIKYCNCMEEIKLRITLIRSVLRGTSLGREDFDYELVGLQLRKILELIAFSSLVANREVYSEVHEKYLHEWRTSRLLENIEKLNPNFYPKSLSTSYRDSAGTSHFPESKKAFLTRNDFTKLLNLCSDLLHVWNPYSPKEKKIDFEIPVLGWVEKIQWLLDIHCVQLTNSENVLLVFMQEHDGNVHVYDAGVSSKTPVSEHFSQ